MISCFRRITHFVSANKRTLFCDTFKLSPLDDESKKKLLDKYNKTRKTKAKREYQILGARKNVTVLRISDPALEDEEEVGCSISVGVGHDDSPDKCLGLAHLLEHVIANAAYRQQAIGHDCETRRFKTLYSFAADNKNYGEVIQTWAKILFDTDNLSKHADDMLEIVRCEREQVDNEFNEKRDNILAWTFMVLKSYDADINLPKFTCGNRETMEPKLNELGNREAMEPKLHGLLTELNELRELYRQRPILICTYSKHQLEMETIVNALNFGNFLSAPSKEGKRPRENDDVLSPSRKRGKRPHENEDGKEQTTQRNGDISNYLFVVESDNNQRQLRLIFPIEQELSLQQSNTIKWIHQMIKCTNENYLLHRLRRSGYATNCFAMGYMIIVVELTEMGLKKVEFVSDHIKGYIKHLHDYLVRDEKLTEQTNKNGLHDFDKLPSNMEKAAKIVTHFDQIDREFIEMNLFRGLSGQDGADFISKHLLKSKNIIHMINARNPEQVLHSLAEKNGGCLPNESIKTESRTELIYRTKFFAVENKVFNRDFKNGYYILETRNREPTSDDDILYETPIDEPKDMAFQRLFAKYLDYHISGKKSFVNEGFMVEEPGKVRYYAANDRDSYNMNMENWLEPKKIQERTFSLSREHLLFDLSTEMRSSHSFAESLMDTALNNVALYGRKIDPVPLQYETLLDMTHEDYLKYTEKITSEVNPPERTENITFPAEFVQDFSFYSIHTNEPVTTTLIFYETLEYAPKFHSYFLAECQKFKEEHDLYTATCQLYTATCKLYNRFANGILINVLSVESKERQDIKTINAACNSLVTRVKKHFQGHKNIDGRIQLALTQTLDRMEKKKIKIQVIGYKEPKINEEKTFKEQFKKWLRHNKTSCEKLRNGI